MANHPPPPLSTRARIAAIVLLAAALAAGPAAPSGAQARIDGWYSGRHYRAPRAVRVHRVLRAARSAIGVPYRYGGTSKSSGFDCSGLTRWSWQHGGDSLPHNSGQQYARVRHVRRKELKPGDLLFFYSPISHVAIYVGHGYMIEAPHSGARVRRLRVYWQYLTGAGRPA